ncbi:uncharacterized protein JCM6883_003554 [Sporobolomyces salmoneus]|uniref:uncharacterized protein n=1 Tax=Sporobolomyces salmoneus TaxID=183962 RepID=UPI00316F651C
MTGLLDLPPELLIRIIEEMRSYWMYTAKERQTDLARIAQVHPITHAVAHSMLYGGDVTARSAGRTHLLARTLLDNQLIPSLIRTLSFKSEMDSGHVESLITILRNVPHLESLTLGAVYFKDPPSDLYTAIQTHTQLRSFSYGFYSAESPFEKIVPLLNSFPNLKHLALDRVAPLQFSGPLLPPSKRGMGWWGPPPTYSLESISISDWRMIGSSGWPLEVLSWLFGSTKSSLRSFQIDFLGLTSLESIFEFLVDRSCTLALERLTIRDFQDLSTLEPIPLDPNSLASTFPNLTHLFLMTNADESSFLTPTPHLLIPPNLQTLQVDDDLFLTWRLLEAVQADSVPTSFKRLRLRGPFPSDPDVKALKRVCEAKGIVCEALRPF